MTALPWAEALTLAFVALALAPVAFALVGAALAPLRPPAPRGPAPEGLSAVVCFHDEAEDLAETVDAFLTAGTPFPVEVLLCGDGASPAAQRVATRLAARPEVRRLPSARRAGKAQAQARGVAAARYPVVLLLDADTRVDPGTPEALACAVASPGVAFAAGRLRYQGHDQGAEDRYWDLEHLLRLRASAGRGLLGAPGGLLCCRRDAYVPCPPEAMLDLVVPLLLERTQAEGGVVPRGIYCPEAGGWEPARPSWGRWRQARVRIQARALASTGLLRGWLVGAGPARSLQFLGHKLLRWWAGPSALMACALGSTLSGWPGTLARAAGLALVLSCGALVLSWRRVRLPWAAAPGYVLYVQVAGLALALAGRAPRTWSPGPRALSLNEEE